MQCLQKSLRRREIAGGSTAEFHSASDRRSPEIALVRFLWSRLTADFLRGKGAAFANRPTRVPTIHNFRIKGDGGIRAQSTNSPVPFTLLLL